MLENYINEKFVVKNQTYQADSHLDTNSWYASGMDKIERISNTVIQLDGMKKKSYPMTSKLFGGQKVKELKGYQYKYPVMVTPDNTWIVAVAPANTVNLGLAYGTFTVTFRDARVKQGWIVQTASGKQVRISGKPERRGDFYVAEVQHNGKSAIPASDFAAGARLAPLFTATSVERSKSAEISIDYPGEVQNQIGILTLGMSWGDIDNLKRVMNYEFTSSDGGSKKQLWMSYFMYQFNQKWSCMVEDAIWYSKWNRDLDANRIALEEVGTGEVIPTFSGLLEQIPHQGTYSKLSYNKLSSMLSNLSFTNEMDVEEETTFEIQTGRGGRMAISDALAEKGLSLVGSFGAGNIADKFITGSGRDLSLTGFFSSFVNIDGIKVKVTYNPRFDYSPVAQAGKRHPIHRHLPLESFRMVFIDTTSQNGEANIQAVTPTPTSNPMNFIHWVVLGGNDAPMDLRGGTGSVTDSIAPPRTSELNVGAYHRRAKMGVQIRNASTCFNFECVAK